MISRKSKTSYKLWSLKNALTRKFETASDNWYIILCKNNKIRVRVLGENVQFIAHCFICTSMKHEIFVIIFYDSNAKTERSQIMAIFGSEPSHLYSYNHNLHFYSNPLGLCILTC